MIKRLKKIEFGKDCRTKMQEGINILATAVGATLGPKGRNIVIEELVGEPRITKDGVSVAKEITLEDPYLNMGAEMLKSVASKANDTAGDGTTTATVLAQSIVKGGMEAVENGANPMCVKRGIDKAVDAVLKDLDKQAKKVNSNKAIVQVGTISANGEVQIGKDICEAMNKVGKDGVILVGESKNLESKIELVDGMKFGSGYLSHHFVTNKARMTVEMTEPLILLHKRPLNNIGPLTPLIEKVVQMSKPLLIIADDVEGEVLSTLVVNKVKGGINFAAVRSPGRGQLGDDLLEDIAILTGATVIAPGAGKKLQEAGTEILGTCDRIVIDKSSTTIINGKGDPDEIDSRVKQIRKLISQCTNEQMKLWLQERFIRMSGSIAVLQVGGATSVEVRERKDRVEDALNATRAAVAEGIVPGGGVALRNSIDAVVKMADDGNFTKDEFAGVSVVLGALTRPYGQIMENAGLDCNIDSRKPTWGKNAMTGEEVDMFKAGIIDPTKVVKSALIAGASVAGLLITTEAMISIVPKEIPAVYDGVHDEMWDDEDEEETYNRVNV